MELIEILTAMIYRRRKSFLFNHERKFLDVDSASKLLSFIIIEERGTQEPLVSPVSQ